MKNWEEWGIDQFKNAQFSVKIGSDTYDLSECTETFGEYYPIREQCNRKGDPSEGCLTADAFHYRAKIPYPKLDNVTIQVLNRNSGSLIYNETYNLRNEKTESWETMNCDSSESCIALCTSWGGFSFEELGYCQYNSYLESLCYRVRHYEDNNYKIDDPPNYDLDNYYGGAGCK